jgi:hypothetical protein
VSGDPAAGALLATLLPVRDGRDRAVAYLVATCPAEPSPRESWGDEEARRTLDRLPALHRLCGRTLVVPVPPALIRDGALARFTTADVVWLLATAAFDDPATRRVVERLLAGGVRFALDGFPEGGPLPTALVGAPVLLDAARLAPAQFAARARLLREAGLQWHLGLPMPHGARVAVDGAALAGALRTIRLLADYADGRPADARLDAYIEADPRLSGALLRALSSAAVAVRGPRSVAQAMTVLGRDAVLERLVGATARLLGEAVADPGMALVAARRARIAELVGAALAPAPHPRARLLAGVLSALPVAAGRPAADLAGELALPPPLADVLGARRDPVGMLTDAIEAHEHGWWADLHSRCDALGIAPLVVSDAYSTGWRAARDDLGPPASEAGGHG